MRRISRAGVLAIVAAFGSGLAHADCLEDFQRAAAAQIVDLDTQEQTAFRSTTIRTDLKTHKVIATAVTEHAPPDRSRTTVHTGDINETTLTTHDRLWIGHGGALQEVPATVARERIDDAHAHLLAFRAHLAAADWSKRAENLTCRTDATLNGHKAELFTFTDAETGLPTRLYVDPQSFEPEQTEATGNGFTISQSIERDPSIHIDLPATPE
jgi:hypothetical protein